MNNFKFVELERKRLGKSPAQFAAWNTSSTSMLKYFDILSIH